MLPPFRSLSTEQITACMSLSKALGEESARLHALLVPPGAEKMVNLKSKEGIRSADKEHLGPLKEDIILS